MKEEIKEALFNKRFIISVGIMLVCFLGVSYDYFLLGTL